MSRFCAYCGSACQDEQKFCPNCGASTEEGKPQPAVPTQSQIPYQTYAPEAQQLPMNWYKFVIWFQLFANALVNAISGITAATGVMYGSSPEQVYAMVPMLKPVDLIYGSLLFGSAILALVARGRLRKFCKNGPMLYYLLLVSQTLVLMFYQVVGGAVIYASVMGDLYQPNYAGVAGNVIGSVILLVCNVIYFNKRKALFVN